ncbi:hypothetical protein L228DRAFT_50475 [Xylona heveae TC161]|uniref:Uncharacterized protein n=1 Tax=Xylona heveae (strain CBS 132557 / TC161) TaxID=1328760 RepID=A0A164ZN40_XYLHT|nr:hypothetical protein L228DRAFT_50475 [Xylona heveae TC161]KZF19299.1 hypothetical protein L228DRAFT_50475 [Xylona heveae TC161]
MNDTRNKSKSTRLLSFDSDVSLKTKQRTFFLKRQLRSPGHRTKILQLFQASSLKLQWGIHPAQKHPQHVTRADRSLISPSSRQVSTHKHVSGISEHKSHPQEQPTVISSRISTAGQTAERSNSSETSLHELSLSGPPFKDLPVLPTLSPCPRDQRTQCFVLSIQGSISGRLSACYYRNL